MSDFFQRAVNAYWDHHYRNLHEERMDCYQFGTVTASVGRSPERQDPEEGLDRNDESGGGEANRPDYRPIPEITALYDALEGLLASCTRTPVGGGDGNTYIVSHPTSEAMRAARKALVSKEEMK